MPLEAFFGDAAGTLQADAAADPGAAEVALGLHIHIAVIGGLNFAVIPLQDLQSRRVNSSFVIGLFFLFGHIFVLTSFKNIQTIFRKKKQPP